MHLATNPRPPFDLADDPKHDVPDRMPTELNPALSAFLASFQEQREWAQVLVHRVGPGYELRHKLDSGLPGLREVSLGELRRVAQFTAGGDFRPIKAAPDLQRGWRFVCRETAELWRALQELYPGSVPDWHAVQRGTATPTDYRSFTNRQTGMYRITQLLTDDQATRVISACCAPQFCLKLRLWTVEGLPTDAPERKSAIPCLEPCAVLLELARKGTRIEQEEKVPVSLTPSELLTLDDALQGAIERPVTARTGDIGSALNPRRVQLLLEKLRSAVNRSTQTKE